MSRLGAARAFHPQLRERVARHPLASLAAVLVALGAIPPLVFALRPEGGAVPVPRHVDHRYATQSGSLYGTRRRHIEEQSQEDLDSALETCAAIGIRPLAARYGLPLDPVRLARRFAAGYEHAYRRRAYEGCLHGLIEGG